MFISFFLDSFAFHSHFLSKMEWVSFHAQRPVEHALVATQTPGVLLPRIYTPASISLFALGLCETADKKCTFSGLHTDPRNQKRWGGALQSVFNEPSRWLSSLLKFEARWSREAS